MPHILEVNGLTTVFDGDGGRMTGADAISFYVDPGEIVCVVGESGCGKSVTSLSIMGLLGRGGQVEAGSAFFEGRDLLNMPEKELDQIRGDALTMIFQDPLTSLNPVFTIGRQITESIRAHMHLDKEEAFKRAVSILERIGMPDAVQAMKKYPHQLSGGMRQRVMIAIALSCNPRLLIADEPTTALDVTIQAQIMQLLRELRRGMGMAVILITHDIGLVAQMADRVLVMYAGQIIEQAPVQELFDDPRHPYTQALLRSVPSIPRFAGTEPERLESQEASGACLESQEASGACLESQEASGACLESQETSAARLESIHGVVPERYDRITGCRFADRCPYAAERCAQPQADVDCGPGRLARCWRAAEGGIQA